jgi:hypothetical protein
MADEKIIKIVAKVDSSSGPSPEQQDKAASQAAIRARMAQQAAEEARLKTLLHSFSVDTEGGQGSYTGSGKHTRGPGTNNRQVPPPAPKGKPGAPPLPPDDDPTSPQGQSKFAKAWKIFQKGVTAVNGANGHLTKSVAFVTRSFEFAKETVGDFKEAGLTASGALNSVKSAGQASATALGASSKAAHTIATAAGVAAGALGMGTLAVGAFVVQVGVATVAIKVLNAVITNMQEVVGNFSGALEAARARSEVADIQMRIRNSAKVGGELAALEGAKSSAARAITDAKTELVNLGSPFIKAALDFFTNALKTANIILGVLNVISDTIEYVVETILEKIASVPILGMAAKKALAWMQQDEINNINAANGLHKNVEDLFRPDGLGFPAKPKKNSVAGKFLP